MICKDSIEVTLPMKAEYVSTARLLVSGLAARAGFDIDTVEDIKVAVAEVCNKLVNQQDCNCDRYRIEVILEEGFVDIAFSCNTPETIAVFDEKNDALGVSIITALMDHVTFNQQGRLIRMTKAIEGKHHD